MQEQHHQMLDIITVSGHGNNWQEMGGRKPGRLIASRRMSLGLYRIKFKELG